MAQEAGSPIRIAGPRNTDVPCRQCRETNPTTRDADEFECWKCGYEGHADVDGAVDIATGKTR
jgi:transposase